MALYVSLCLVTAYIIQFVIEYCKSSEIISLFAMINGRFRLNDFGKFTG